MTGNFGKPENIEPAPDSPCAVQFQPDTANLLDLLVGGAVHGPPVAAVTELVLNAFDAIRNRVALQRLALPPAGDAADPAWDYAFRQDDQVILEMFGNGKGLFLRCSDTGIGLDAETISQRLLCPGKSRSPAWLELEAKCQARGFHMPGRNTRGLGFLTYFMLAEAVKIRSRRFVPTGGGLSRRVVFKSEGPRSLSFLRSLPADFGGPASTSVTLRLKKKATGMGTQFDPDPATWLSQPPVRSPCPLYLFSGRGTRVIPSGWSPEIPVITPRIVHACPGVPNLKRLTTTPATRDLITALTSIPAEHLPEAGVCIGVETQEYHVSGLATLRCTAPWISYRGNKAMVWATDAHPVNPSGHYTMVALTHESRTGLQGIHCQITGEHLPGLSPNIVAPGSWCHSSRLPPWGYLTLDIDLDDPPLETFALNRSFVTPTAATRLRLEEFCLKSLHHMLGVVRRKYPGTLLAEQMEELQENFQKAGGAGG